jgi:hypothetical protein
MGADYVDWPTPNQRGSLLTGAARKIDAKTLVRREKVSGTIQ